MTFRSQLRPIVEIAAWMAAIWCLGTWGLAQALQVSAPPVQQLWSPGRVTSFSARLLQAGPAPIAILRIRRLGVDVAVREGTDDATLERGAGHIEDTAAPGENGNAGIAAHRDGFFRPLQDIHADDVLEIETRRGVTRYRVERTWIVDPEDVSVLDPTREPAVTLVTCYPFYFVGSAPQRFIVRAVRITS